jgi:hypothetical protein
MNGDPFEEGTTQIFFNLGETPTPPQLRRGSTKQSSTSTRVSTMILQNEAKHLI